MKVISELFTISIIYRYDRDYVFIFKREKNHRHFCVYLRFRYNFKIEICFDSLFFQIRTDFVIIILSI